MGRAGLIAFVLAVACSNGERPVRAADPMLPASDSARWSFPPGASADDLLPAVDQGLSDPRKGPEMFLFAVLRAGDRHGAAYREKDFHVVIGGGIRLPEGALRIARAWGGPSGMIDGNNEQPQRNGVSIVVEPGTPRPYAAAVRQAATAFCAALARRIPLHPDCVLAMEEIAYTAHHEAGPDERELARAARASVPIPPADGRLAVISGGKRHEVDVERRVWREGSAAGINVGMMFRRGFDGENRGMLFVYPWRSRRNFYMKNCRIPIDLAYIKNGAIEQIESMQPQWGAAPRDLRYYESDTPVRYVLEMPAGWFASRGVKTGDRVEFE